MYFLGTILLWCLSIYSFIIILQVLLSWLVVFGVINVNNDKAQALINVLRRATEPLFEKLRKFIPPIGGLDLTPLVVLLAIYFLQRLIASSFLHGAYAYYM